MISNVDLYVGVDWSGARGTRLKSLRVAACEKGRDAPKLIAGPHGGDWSRPAFLHWLLARLNAGTRVACGLDFSFCFPYCDHDTYFPGLDGAPGNVRAFWSEVEAVCAADGDLFGGGLAERVQYASYFRSRGAPGERYERRLRVTERACQEQGLGAPESVFNLIGPRQVGKSSLAGIRFLLALKAARSRVAIWPFDDVEAADCIVLETFPTAFVRHAGGGPGKVRTLSRLNDVLTFYGTDTVDLGSDALSDDETDALITAAALRALTPEQALWKPASLSDRVRRYEGWTFGVD